MNPSPLVKPSLLPQAIEYTDQLTLAYDDDIISLEFAALNFAAPEGNRYRYRLEGLEEELERGRQQPSLCDLHRFGCW